MIDGTLKLRRSNKMVVVLWHLDHCDSKINPGDQSVTLGMVTERVFLSLDSEFKVGAKAEQSSDAQQKLDGQCAAMRRLREAREQA